MSTDENENGRLNLIEQLNEINCITIASRYEFFWQNLDERRKFYIIEI